MTSVQERIADISSIFNQSTHTKSDDTSSTTTKRRTYKRYKNITPNSNHQVVFSDIDPETERAQQAAVVEALESLGRNGHLDINANSAVNQQRVPTKSGRSSSLSGSYHHASTHTRLIEKYSLPGPPEHLALSLLSSCKAEIPILGTKPPQHNARPSQPKSGTVSISQGRQCPQGSPPPQPLPPLQTQPANNTRPCQSRNHNVNYSPLFAPDNAMSGPREAANQAGGTAVAPAASLQAEHGAFVCPPTLAPETKRRKNAVVATASNYSTNSNYPKVGSPGQIDILREGVRVSFLVRKVS